MTALKELPQLYARKNVGFIGNTGVGKTHLAMAYAREVCKRGMKAYFIKANQLNQRFLKAQRVLSRRLDDALSYTLFVVT